MRVLEKPLDRSKLTKDQRRAIEKLFKKGNLTALMHSKQKELDNQLKACASEDFLIFCGRQWGKTHFGLCIAIAYAIKHPGSRILYYAPNKQKLADIINDGLEPLLEWAPKGLIRRLKAAGRWKVGKSELRINILKRAHVGGNRGTNAKGLIIIEEAGFVSSDDFRYAFENIIEAQRLKFSPRCLIITTPSEEENHYVHKVLKERLEPLGAVASYSIYDNPFLSDEKIQKVRRKVTAETWLREYMGQITKATQQLCVPEFDMQWVKKLEPPEYANWLTSIDLGGVKDPHGILLTYHDYKRRKFCIYRESLLPVNSTLELITSRSKELEKEMTKGPHYRVVDGKGQLSVELDNMRFLHTTPKKGPGSFEAMLNALRIGIQNGEVEVDESCTQLINQLSFGKFDKLRKDFARTEEMGHLDLIAAAMYAFQEQLTSNPFPLLYQDSTPFRATDFDSKSLDPAVLAFQGIHDDFE